METSLQNLIDYATEKYGSNSDIANDLICYALMLKKEEKDQITEAYYSGSDYDYLHLQTAEEYYIKTYKK
jgi:hypothetical protein